MCFATETQNRFYFLSFHNRNLHPSVISCCCTVCVCCSFHPILRVVIYGNLSSSLCVINVTAKSVTAVTDIDNTRAQIHENSRSRFVPSLTIWNQSRALKLAHPTHWFTSWQRLRWLEAALTTWVCVWWKCLLKGPHTSSRYFVSERHFHE